jgi:hypothetical protein
MSRSTRRILRMALGLVSAVALALTVGPPAAATAGPATPAPTWELIDFPQRACLAANQPQFTYFWFSVRGEWSTPLEVGAEDLPPGTTTLSLPHPPIPPGSSEGGSPLTLVTMNLPALDLGDHVWFMTASDGVVTQRVPITIRAQERWGCPVW